MAYAGQRGPGIATGVAGSAAGGATRLWWRFWAGRFVHGDADYARDPVQVGIAGQERRLVAPGDGGDHAVDETPWGNAGLAAAPVSSTTRS
jgi:hypothetical protein